MNSFIRSLVLNFKKLRKKLWSVEKNHSSRQMWAEETIERMFDQNHLIPGKVCKQIFVDYTGLLELFGST